MSASNASVWILIQIRSGRGQTAVVIINVVRSFVCQVRNQSIGQVIWRSDEETIESLVSFQVYPFEVVHHANVIISIKQMN